MAEIFEPVRYWFTMYWCNPWDNITVNALGIAVKWLFERFQDVSVGEIQLCTKDMFGSRPKTGTFLVRIRTGAGRNLIWVQTMPTGPIQDVPVEGVQLSVKDLFGSGPKPRYFGQDPDRR
jgi:hypothetical protein